MGGGQEELREKQGLRKVKTKALLLVGTKETKGCGSKFVIACWKAVG